MPSKWIWTDRDFPELDFHMVEIRGIGFVNDFPDRLELLLDLDYIVKWVTKNLPGSPIEFWVSPTTLVFKDVFDLKMSVDATQPSLQIDYLDRKERLLASGMKTFDWRIDFQDAESGAIQFVSTGFNMFIRKRPLLLASRPYLDWSTRGGFSFERKPAESLSIEQNSLRD